MKKIMIVSNTIPPETNGQATMLGRLLSNIFTDQHIYVQRLPYIEKDKKYVIQNKVNGEYLKRILLNPDYLEWTNDINEAVDSRAGLFRVVQLLEKEEKLKIMVVEK